MKSSLFIPSILCILAACTAKEPGDTLAADDDGGAASSTGGVSMSSNGEATGIGGGEPSTGASAPGDNSTGTPDGTSTGGDATTTGGFDEESADVSEGGGDPTLPVPVPPECMAVDHANCYPAVVEACYGNGNWAVDEECVAAVAQCYPIGTDALAPADVIGFCSAEFGGECISDDHPGCSETFCTCTAGAYPFDWDNCWHLTLIGCYFGVESDCESVLAGCYPGVTVPEYEGCKAEVFNNDDAIGDCNCPMCGNHEWCEDALAECLGG